MSKSRLYRVVNWLSWSYRQGIVVFETLHRPLELEVDSLVYLHMSGGVMDLFEKGLGH